MIYFIQDSLTKHIKIGWTAGSPNDRLAQLQTGCPGKLVLLQSWECAQEDEHAAHCKFGHLRVRGEWFLPEPELLSWIMVTSRSRAYCEGVFAGRRLGMEELLYKLADQGLLLDDSTNAEAKSYRGTDFYSPLEACWAAFFDLIGWHWEYLPEPVNDWQPRFLVEWPCGHSECSGKHTLLADVQPFDSFEQFQTADSPGLLYPYGFDPSSLSARPIGADSSAVFGSTPAISWWEMGHGAGGGEECLENWVDGDLSRIWQEACRRVRFLPGGTS